MTPYLIVAGDFVTTGGMDRANHALAAHLARRGDEVHLVAYRASDELLGLGNIIFHRVPKPGNRYLLGEPMLDRVGRYWARKICAGGGRVIVNGGNCQWGDVNWVHYVHAAYKPEIAGNLAQKIKCRWTHRSSLASERRALHSARLIIANSFRTRQDIVEKVGVPEDRTRVVYYGTDSESFSPATSAQRAAIRTELGWPRERPVVAFVGALGDRRKGFDTLFNAWRELCRDTAWDVDLAVIGRGAELQRWKSLTAESNLAARIHYLGFRADVSRVLSACDALVSPTRYEAFGLGVQEAWYCGLPAIVSAIAGASEQCPAGLKNLCLQDPESVEELGRRLKSWRANIDTYRTIAMDCTALHRRPWDEMAREFVAVMESANTPGSFSNHSSIPAPA